MRDGEALAASLFRETGLKRGYPNGLGHAALHEHGGEPNRPVEPKTFRVPATRWFRQKRCDLQGLPKRLMGLEPTTFCMTSR